MNNAKPTKLTDTRPQQANANKHTPRGLSELERSIQRDGWVGAITVAADGETFDGSARLEVGVAAGFDDAIIVESDGSRPVIVRRTDIPTADDPRARRLGISANRVAELDLAWDAGVLADLAADGLDLDGLWTAEELAAFFAEAERDETAGESGGSEPTAEEPDAAQTRVRPGDLWALRCADGREHRLLCGDSTNAADVAALLGGARPDLVWADPPYGVRVVQGGTVGANIGVVPKGTYAPVMGDETTDTAARGYATLSGLYPTATHIWWGANNYADALPSSSCWLVWDKRADSGIQNNFADGELAWTSLTSPTRIYRQLWNGMVREGERDKRVHPTQKPVDLAVWAFGQYAPAGAVICDPFAGSGMALIAGERTGRTVHSIEAAPEYVAVILTRWEAETGRTAVLVERAGVTTRDGRS